LLAYTLPAAAAWLTERGGLERIGEDLLVFFYDEETDSFYSEATTKLQPSRS
jgi:hypothetical protein